MLFTALVDLFAACLFVLSAIQGIGAWVFATIASLFGYYGAVGIVSLLIAFATYLSVYIFFPKVSSFSPVTAGWTTSKKHHRNYEHVWVKGDMLLLDHGQGPAYCNACSNLVLQGVTCLVCRRCAHEEHHQFVENQPCKTMHMATAIPGLIGELKRKGSRDSITSATSKGQIFDTHKQFPVSSTDDHQFVEGNLPVGAKCAVCRASAGSEPSLKDMRCIWCDVAVHTTCLNHYQRRCPFGPFPSIVVPPQFVTRISSAARGSTKKSEPRFSVSTLPPTVRPLLCIVNPASGAQNSAALLRGLFGLMNPVQIVDTSRENPEALIRAFDTVIDQCRILVCGGDGTIQWAISILDKIVPPGKPKPPVGVLPLGTGNDLARVLGWGGGWTGEEIKDVVRDMNSADEVDLDRWTITIEEKQPTLSSTEKVGRALHLRPKKSVSKTWAMNNYFSMGTDASVALDFHTTRLRQPQFFRNRLLNKVWYAALGGKHQFKNLLSFLGLARAIPAPAGTSVLEDETASPNGPVDDDIPPSPSAHEPLSESRLYVDTEAESVDLSDLGALIVLNIPSYGGGGKIYAAAEAEGHPKSRFDDGKLEILGVASPLHLGASVVGLSSPAVLAQAKKIKIEVDRAVAMQVDGEPWLQQGPCSVSIDFLGRTKMLRKKVFIADSGLETEDEDFSTSDDPPIR